MTIINYAIFAGEPVSGSGISMATVFKPNANPGETGGWMDGLKR